MRNILLYTLSALALLTAISCNQEIIPDTPIEEGGITLTLHNLAPRTRAEGDEDTMAGVEELNENLINSIHYFFYPKDGTDTNTEQEPALWNSITGLTAQASHTFRINVSEAELKETLFKYPYNECDVYVIVNLPSEKLKNLTDHKLSTLKAIVVEADFENSLKQDNFVMEGLGKAQIIDRRKVLAANGEIGVDRLAAKISVGISVRETLPANTDLYNNDEIWTSVPEEMVVEFINGSSKTVLSGNPADLDEAVYFHVDEEKGRLTTDSDNNQIWTCDPFYSYPSAWDIGADEEPYLRITLPWETVININVDGEEEPIIQQEKCIYKVILGGEEIRRNTWYDLTISIGILGSFENQEEVILPIDNINYFVADWSNGKSVESEILGGRYLVVDNTEYKIYNETTLSIPFTSSHECVIVDAKCTYLNHKANPSTEVAVDENDYVLDIVGGNAIQFSHALNNDMLSTELDFTPFTITFTIRHSDDDDYKEEITITQYPAIYVEEYYNTDYTNGGTAGGDNGYVWVNGYQGSSGSSNLDFFAGTGYSSSADPRMFVFTITTTEGTDFIIGDPRETEGYTYDADDARWYNGTSIYTGSNRELQYYYGTAVVGDYSTSHTSADPIYNSDEEAEAAEPTINMVAPKFRLASGYAYVSTTSTVDLETFKKRCASYQEDGYPAGRWRLPTRAEFQFILTQINYQNLPTVYLESYDYWCAHGLGEPTNTGLVRMHYISDRTNGGFSSITPVRCVYDEWYWENSETYRLGAEDANGTFVPSDTFTWGDMPRSEFK